MTIFIVSFIFLNSSKEALIMISSIGVIFLIFFFISNKIVKKYSFKRSTFLQKKNNLIKEFLDGIREVINFCQVISFHKNMMNLILNN